MFAAALYLGGYQVDRYIRVRRGPWEVTFTATSAGEPVLLVEQSALGIRGVRIVFAGEAGAPQTNRVRFTAPVQAVPFGRVKYADLTYLPGVLTFEAFGHEIELLPRTLYVNRQPRSWEAELFVVLSATNRPASLPEPIPRRRRP